MINLLRKPDIGPSYVSTIHITIQPSIPLRKQIYQNQSRNLKLHIDSRCQSRSPPPSFKQMSMRPGMRVDEKEDGDEDIWHILSFCVCGGVGNTEQKNIQWQHPKQKTKKQFTFILQYAITQDWLYFHLKNRSDDLYILNSVCVFWVFFTQSATSPLPG